MIEPNLALKPNQADKIMFFLLVFLIIFLPFSSWLISLSGIAAISLLRDLLVALILILAIFSFSKRRWNIRIIVPILIFILWAALSFFWREASAAQWLRGFRFIFPPIVLLICLASCNFDLKHKSLLFKTTLSVAAVIVVLALFDLFNLPLPLTTSLSGSGSLESAHYVGLLMIKRLQAVLAGPNALGLYLLPVLAMALSCPKKSYVIRILVVLLVAVLLLTFSRSCLLGLVAMMLLFAWRKYSQQIGVAKIVLISFVALLLFMAASYGAYKTEWGKQLINHNSSSEMRFEQYGRIWSQRSEIGLLGRGLGTAGPSSINRLDGGENHWTENFYLDLFEELGLIGLVMFIILNISVIIKLSKRQGTFLAGSAYLSVAAYSMSGLFINYYTGQAGIWMVMIFVGLALSEVQTFKTKESTTL